ncbi:phosphonate ABC transporter, permease protein PhnE [Phenylobacterium sp. LH3H17]|uniref:phosphonate ABC transporter, permease protein PhnE n=1 Tax=Phenylobacterium sp. LH3H17 TaxID=2903901 RepID=UPI0020CA1A0A|nr:phosphonate ABC transporter, permease protein PhnE [Phenylobacterium sp. LH3H17]UTP38496.1 phosphonate ABC transporter, permease protein PhnE [Phenylobacterium sp. LH3H17]
MNLAVAEFESLRRRTLRRQRLRALAGLLIFSAVLLVSFQRSQFFSSDIGGDPLGRVADFLTRMIPDLKAEALVADSRTKGSLAWWFYDLPVWLKLGWQTVEMAIVATVLGAAGGLVASFLCARNLMPFPAVRFAVRRTLEAIRTLPDLILALILVAAFGVGPLAGVITLAISTVGGLGKLFAEINEEVDPRQLEAMEAAGVGPLSRIRYGVVPQVLPNYASYVLIRLEGNLAGAAALGIVGAGGIGLELQRAITYTEFDTYLAILLLIVCMIFVIDLTSEAIRHRLIGLAAAR